ncbi:Methyltransferase type 11 [Coriobacterium glomerans PW2]|uniref:Methyltransferase type 11 n=1 Tax=Coriobacterium glomerans (strain ATCC 49209 / DSM 20642 / JCM 10262 / PW2) TaxID=700015 RepID=F2N8C8_CORGP|nr:class I SAM-dependent methyltransferase [Coriobacterium glomerans]AEB07311.1 Methyltransferase type 11 [Coriobacterium glomerans PW2]
MREQEAEARSQTAFDRHAATYDDDIKGRHARTLYPAVMERLARLRFDTVLDIGCGTGAVLDLITRHDPNVRALGIDLSERMVQRATDRLAGRAEITLGDAKHLPFDEYAQRLTAPLTLLVDDATLTFRMLLQRLPSLSDVESPDDPSYEAFHRGSSSWIHDLSSLKVCSIMVPHVAEAIRRANERGETCIEDCDAAASFAVFGQMGVLLDTTLDKKERVERIQAFLHRLLDI